jgi:hypothetical protein
MGTSLAGSLRGRNAIWIKLPPLTKRDSGLAETARRFSGRKTFMANSNGSCPSVKVELCCPASSVRRSRVQPSGCPSLQTSCSLNLTLAPVARYTARISQQIVRVGMVRNVSPIEHGNLPANIADAILSP